MNKNLTPLLFSILICISSCKDDNDTASQRRDLRELLHGKYEILMATADQNVDINNDGISSNNILTEIPNIQHAHLELLIIENSNTNLFYLLWPEQFIDFEANPTQPVINYAFQGRAYQFNFDPQNNKIEIDKTELSDNDPGELVYPDSIDLLKDKTIQVVFKKNTYTRTGWKDITVKVIYKRFTTRT